MLVFAHSLDPNRTLVEPAPSGVNRSPGQSARWCSSTVRWCIARQRAGSLWESENRPIRCLIRSRPHQRPR